MALELRFYYNNDILDKREYETEEISPESVREDIIKNWQDYFIDAFIEGYVEDFKAKLVNEKEIGAECIEWLHKMKDGNGAVEWTLNYLGEEISDSYDIEEEFK